MEARCLSPLLFHAYAERETAITSGTGLGDRFTSSSTTETSVADTLNFAFGTPSEREMRQGLCWLAPFSGLRFHSVVEFEDSGAAGVRSTPPRGSTGVRIPYRTRMWAK